ncbi:GcrA family cell cycle regulator [Polycladidibacter hongkongensis]|uniref:GcrA family cell cycle regulator n=1 Tax=Polycladidibacter hongkongensis TaxID=1647556 RepID=UPI000834A73D|nr:GcrA family cell cycle regulator [Pseudovibrio hongkongensis]
MSWTAERVELLTKLWAEGLSASQIASELGNVTRNAVIGKVHRLGLSGRAKSGGGQAAKPRRTASNTSSASPAALAAAAPKAEAAQENNAGKVQADPATAQVRRMPQAVVSGATALKVEPEEELATEVVAATPEIFIPENERATILSLTERTCKWPIGDPGSPDFYFCGRQSDAGTPYCAHHRSIAYQPVSDRRQRKAAS